MGPTKEEREAARVERQDELYEQMVTAQLGEIEEVQEFRKGLKARAERQLELLEKQNEILCRIANALQKGRSW